MQIRSASPARSLVIGLSLGVSVVSTGLAEPALAQPVVVAIEPAPVSRPPGRACLIASTYIMIGGAALLGVGYVTNAVLGWGAGYSAGGSDFGWLGGGGSTGHNPAWSEFRTWSFVPVVGPFVQLSLLPPGGQEGGWPGRLVATGLIQAVGLGAVVTGLVTRLLSPSSDEDGVTKPSFVITPMLTATDAGLVATGRF